MLSFYRLAAFVLLVFASCTKIDSTDLGGDLIPEVDDINTFDTLLDVQTRMGGFDTVAVGLTELHSLGKVNDPIFGGTDAQMNFELRPLIYPYTFEKSRDSLFADSIVLVMQFGGAWGDTLTPLNLTVNEISTATPFKTDSVYTNVAGANFQSAGQLGTSSVNILRLRDTIRTFRDSGVGQIRIRLVGNNIADRLLRQFDTSNAYRSDSAFRTRFAGFQVLSSSGNALLKINLASTKLGIYYRFKQTNGSDSSNVRFFGLSTSSGVANRIIRTPSAAITAALTGGPANQPLVYMAASPGTFANVSLPTLPGFPVAAIHRAELVLEQNVVDPANDGLFTPPLLLLTGSNDTAPRFAVPFDFGFGANGIQNYSTYGGFPERVSDVSGSFVRYKFTLTRYVQNVLIGRVKPIRFRLLAPHNPVIYSDGSASFGALLSNSGPVNNAAIGRVLLHGGAHPTRPMKLRIIYSKQ